MLSIEAVRLNASTISLTLLFLAGFYLIYRDMRRIDDSIKRLDAVLGATMIPSPVFDGASPADNASPADGAGPADGASPADDEEVFDGEVFDDLIIQFAPSATARTLLHTTIEELQDAQQPLQDAQQPRQDAQQPSQDDGIPVVTVADSVAELDDVQLA